MNPRTILITGASGGIGRRLVEQALLRWPDACIFAVSRKAAFTRDFKDQNPNLIELCCDLGRTEDRDRLSDRLASETKIIDLAIHTPGILNGKGKKPEKSLREIDSEAMIEAFQVNAVTAIHLGQILKPFFRNTDPSVLMFLSAKVGSIGDNELGGWYSYRMSKAALNMGVRTMALEFQRSGCKGTVLAVHPGTTRTGFSEDYVKNWPEQKIADASLTAERLLDLSVKLGPESNGTFIHWDGTALPW